MTVSRWSRLQGLRDSKVLYPGAGVAGAAVAMLLFGLLRRKKRRHSKKEDRQNRTEAADSDLLATEDQPADGKPVDFKLPGLRPQISDASSRIAVPSMGAEDADSVNSLDMSSGGSSPTNSSGRNTPDERPTNFKRMASLAARFRSEDDEELEAPARVPSASKLAEPRRSLSIGTAPAIPSPKSSPVGQAPQSVVTASQDIPATAEDAPPAVADAEEVVPPAAAADSLAAASAVKDKEFDTNAVAADDAAVSDKILAAAEQTADAVAPEASAAVAPFAPQTPTAEQAPAKPADADADVEAPLAATAAAPAATADAAPTMADIVAGRAAVPAPVVVPQQAPAAEQKQQQQQSQDVEAPSPFTSYAFPAPPPSPSPSAASQATTTATQAFEDDGTPITKEKRKPSLYKDTKKWLKKTFSNKSGDMDVVPSGPRGTSMDLRKMRTSVDNRNAQIANRSAQSIDFGSSSDVFATKDDGKDAVTKADKGIFRTGSLKLKRMLPTVSSK